jgi:hypothetical protein
MKVYVVMKGYDYEGYTDPAAVFSTLAVAEKFAKSMKIDRHQWVDVFERELDSSSDRSVEHEWVCRVEPEKHDFR